VCDPARKQAEALQLLRLENLRFELLALLGCPSAHGDVDVDADDATDLAMVMDGGDDIVKPTPLAPHGKHHLFVHGLAGKDAAVVGLPQGQGLQAGGDVLGPIADEVTPVPPTCGVLQEVAAVPANGEDVERQALDNGLQERLVFAQGGLGPLLLGNVLDRSENSAGTISLG